jgi:hypothetical protein
VGFDDTVGTVRVARWRALVRYAHWQTQDVDEVNDETPTITLRSLPAFDLQVGLGLTSSIWGLEWLIALLTLRDGPPSRRYLRAHIC